MGEIEPLGGALEVELDDLGGAGPHQKEQLDVGPPREQLGHHTVELLVGIGQAGQVAVVDDGGCKARLGKDHHAGGRLNEVCAGARTHHEKEGVLYFSVQPNDAGEATKDFVLPALTQDLKRQQGRVHPMTSVPMCMDCSRRARRSL